MAYTTVNAGDEILAEHHNGIVGSLTGESGKGQQILLTDYSSASNYAFTVKNPGSGGKAVRILAANGNEIGLFNDSSSFIKSQDGTDYITISNSGVAVTGAFSINGQTVGAGFKVYNVLDYGIVTGTTSAPAAANTTALQSLWSTVATAGGGTIFFPAGTYPLNATTLNHGQGGSKAIRLRGEPGASLFFFGTAGPYLAIGTAASSQISRGGIEGLLLQHSDAPTSGATVTLGDVNHGFRFRDVHWIASSSTIAPIVCLQLGSGSFAGGGVSMDRCTLATKTSGAAVHTCVLVANTVASGAWSFTDCSFNGDNATGYGIRFTNSGSGDVDSIQIKGCNIKDFFSCVDADSFCSANIANVTISDSYLDGATGYNLRLGPSAGGDISTWLLSNVWMSSTDTNVKLYETNGGTVANIFIQGGYMTNAVGTTDNAAVLVATGVSTVTLNGIHIGTSIDAGSKYGVDIAGAAGAIAGPMVTNCRIVVGGSASGAARYSSGADPINVHGNQYRGVDATFGGATGASRVNADNAFLA